MQGQGCPQACWVNWEWEKEAEPDEKEYTAEW